MSNIGKTLQEATNVAIDDYVSFNSKTWRIYKIGALGLSKGFKGCEHNNETNKVAFFGNNLNLATIVEAP